MVIYEVNLEVVSEIFESYYHWLVSHVKDILKIEGFKTAEIAVSDEVVAGKKEIRVSYCLESNAALQNYLTHHAPALRTTAKLHFGEQFSAKRRVLLDSVLLS